MEKLKQYYRNSYLCKISKGIKQIVRNSFFVKKISNSNCENISDSSKAINFLEKVFNFMYLIKKDTRYKMKKVFESSISGKIIDLIGNYMYLIVGLVMVLFMIIPHRLWNNWYGVIIMTMIYIVYMFWKNIIKDEIIRFKRIDFSIYAFYLFLLLAVLTSANLYESIKSFLFYMTAFLITIIVVDSLDLEGKIERFIDVIIVGTFITGLYGIYQWKIVGIAVDLAYTDMSNNEGLPGRVFSTMGNPNNYAIVLILMLPLFAYKFLHQKKWIKKGLYAVLASPVLLCLILTSSRAAWGGIFIAFMIFLAIRYPKFLPIVAILGLVSIPFIPDWIINRAITVFKSTDGSIGYRGLIYKTTMPMLQDFWVTGIGLGTRTYMGIIKGYPILTKAVPIHTHNVYLQMWIELGVLGGLSFVYMLIRMVKKPLLKIKEVMSLNKKDLLAILSVSIIGVMIVGTVEYVLFYQRVIYVLFMLIALMHAVVNVYQKKSE